jgi:uncharacterized membrane protein HdeD (DUF308 family)
MDDNENRLWIMWLCGLIMFFVGLVLQVNPILSLEWIAGQLMFVAGIGMIFGAMGYYCGLEEAIEND